MGKKWMTLLLAGVIAASALTGCMSTNSSEPDSSVQSESDGGSSDASDDGTSSGADDSSDTAE